MMAKIKWYLIGAAILLFLALVFTLNIEHNRRVREQVRADRLEENQRQYLIDSLKYIKLTQTVREFKETLSRKLDSILAVSKIKPRQVTGVIERHYYYRDTSYSHYAPVPLETDSGKIYPFLDLKDCFRFEGFMKNDKNLQPELTVTKREFINNSIDVAYLERPYKFLFIKWGRWKAKLKSVNQCGDATIKEIEVIK